MKICAIICEYNPFHNGHLYQLQRAREISGADTVLCIMSGNFTQRGEAAILEKHVRATHAIKAGADIVIELPTVFATSNAELFAKGAIKILNAIPAVEYLSFGAETADIQLLQKAATLLNNEPNEVSNQIKILTSEGMGYAKARAKAWENYIPPDILSTPNNMLALEYLRALQALNSKIQPIPVQRLGGGYRDENLQKNFSSATAIREAIKTGKSPKDNLPDYVLNDFFKNNTQERLELLEKHAILSTQTLELAEICDCTEGLENAFKKAAEQPISLVDALTSSRYTSARIRRIALHNLLKINEKHIRESLSTDLYLRVLCANKKRNDILSAISESSFPIIVRAHDEEKLNTLARQCFESDRYAEKIYGLLHDTTTEKNIFI